MNTATRPLHERLRAFFSNFSFILKGKYDFFRHHSREVGHHALHKSPLSESVHRELEVEKELIVHYFSSLFAVLKHYFHELTRLLVPPAPATASPEAMGGLAVVRPFLPKGQSTAWHESPVLALPQPSLPAPEEHYLLTSASLPLSPSTPMAPLPPGDGPERRLCDPQKLSAEPVFQKIEKSLATLRRFYFTEMVSIVLIILLLGIFFTTLAASSNRYKQPLVFQGRVTGSDHIPLADGQYDMRFAIYSDTAGTACVWATGSCDTRASVPATVSRGLFTVPFGDTTYHANMPVLSLNFENGTFFVGVTVCGTTPASSCTEGEMTPRVQMGGTAYSYNADLFDGLESTQFLRSDTVATSSVSVSTNHYLAFASTDVNHGVSDATTGLQQANTWLKIKALDANGAGSGGAFIAGISDASSTPGMRIIGSIGVPNGNPADDIAAVYIGGEKSDGANGRAALGANETVFQVDTYGTQLLTLLGSGNFGIGTTAPGSALDVKGTLRLSGTTSGYLAIKAPAAVTTSTTFTLPGGDGTNGQLLTTNGSGTLSWTTVGSSSSALSALTAAAAANSINNAAYAQTWNWDGLTNQTGLLLGSNSMTGGTIFQIMDTSTSTQAGNAITFTKSGAYTTNLAYSGNLLRLNRSPSAAVGATLTVSGAALSINDSCGGAGTCTSTGDTVEIYQTYSTNSGSALNITTAGTGFALRVNDDGTLTDSSPFVVDDNGFVGVGTSTPGALLTVAGPIATDYKDVTADYTLTDSDSVIAVDSASGSVYLPTASSTPGRVYTIIKSTSTAGTVFIKPLGCASGPAQQTINGTASCTTQFVNDQWKFKTVVSTGSGWIIIGAN